MEGRIQEQGVESEVSVSRIDPCRICGKRIMANSVLCVKCRKYVEDAQK